MFLASLANGTTKKLKRVAQLVKIADLRGEC